MPLIIVCGVCGRSEVEIRTFELTMRGYPPDKPRSNRFMRRVKAGTTDLCEKCLAKLSDDSFRTFKEQSEFVITPKRRYQKTKFSIRAKKPVNGAESPTTS
jgi:hypothetical protein